LASVGVKPEPAVQSRTKWNWRNQTTIHLAVLIALGLLVTWPLLVHGAPDLSHDGVDHARWAKQFVTQFWQGDLFPRWFTDVNGGFGGPSGFFYPPLTSYAATPFWPFMAARDPAGWWVAGYALALAQILSGITAYWWLRSLAVPRAALLGAIVYAVAPYHLAMDAYVRGASAEAWVFVWFPLVMLSAEGLLVGSRWAFAGATASYALAVLSHPTVSLCFAPIPMGYVVFFSKRKQRVRILAMMTAALLLGVGVAAEYLLPAILDQDKAYVAWQTLGHFDYRNQWLWQDVHELTEMGRYICGKIAGTAPQLDWESLIKLPFLVTSLATSIAIAALFLIVRRWEKAGGAHRMALFYGLVALVSLFLMTKFSSLIWQTAPFLKFVQFPFRLNVMLVISVAVLSALAAPGLLLRRARIMTLLLSAMLLGWVGFDAVAAAQAFSVWRTVMPVRMALTRQLTRTQIDYSTMWPRPGNLAALSDFTAFDRFVATHPPKTADLRARSTGKTAGAVEVVNWRPRRVELKVDAPYNLQLTLNHFYYAGWQGRIGAAAMVLPARPSADGLIQFEVPQGSYTMVVELPKDPAERIGMGISLFSLALLGAATMWGWRRTDPAITAEARVDA
jgi:hypothetical protein